jgi:hypothetical protein
MNTYACLLLSRDHVRHAPWFGKGFADWNGKPQDLPGHIGITTRGVRNLKRVYREFWTHGDNNKRCPKFEEII